MIVVADTTPLNYLIQLGSPDILKKIYGQVVVSPAVLTEMQHRDAPPDVRVWAATPPSWLWQISVRHLDESLAVELGAVEREAISLALELHADVLLICTRADTGHQTGKVASGVGLRDVDRCHTHDDTHSQFLLAARTKT